MIYNMYIYMYIYTCHFYISKYTYLRLFPYEDPSVFTAARYHVVGHGCVRRPGDIPHPIYKEEMEGLREVRGRFKRVE
jgi:hypothetical protein